MSGREHRGPGFGAEFVAALVRGHWHILWPGVSPALVAVVYAVLLSGAATAAFGGWLWWQATAGTATTRYRRSPLP